MSLIDISKLTFSYDGIYDNLFEEVSLQIDTDWKLGFTGRNGRGKTTFLQLLQDKYEYRGTITKKVFFDYFPFEINNPALNTIEVLAAVNPDLVLWELEREFSKLKIAEEVLYRPFCTLSNGEQTKVLLAALFTKNNHFLLIDEPTNHLDMEGREMVGKYLRFKQGFILVSHDRTFLDSCIDHILTINKTNIEVQKGNFSAWFQNKQRQDHYEIRESEKLKKEIKRLSKTAKRTGNWSEEAERSKYGSGPIDRGYVGHKAAKMMKRAKAIEVRQQAVAEEKAKLLKNIETVEHLKIAPLNYRTEQLAELKEVTVFYGDRPAGNPVSFIIRRGDRIALQGKNGSGKSSILKLLYGADLNYTGIFRPSCGLVVSYVPQDPNGLKGSLTDYARQYGIDVTLFKTILRKLDFSRLQFEKDMQHFSSGQKKKVLMARSLCEKAHLYLWDEPLNYMDIFSRIQIEEVLQSSQLTLLLVEHDKTFLDHVATQVVKM